MRAPKQILAILVPFRRLLPNCLLIFVKIRSDLKFYWTIRISDTMTMPFILLFSSSALDNIKIYNEW